MKASRIAEVLAEAYKQRKPHFVIRGKPGCGKTSVLYQLADNVLKVPRYTFQATLYDPVELKGLPVFVKDGNTAQFVRFQDMPSAKEGLLVIDDLPHAPTQTQNAFMRIFLEGIAGSWDIDNLFVVATGNRAEDRAGAKDMQTAMANRVVFLDFNIDYEDWRAWAIQHEIAAQVIAFLGSPYGQTYIDKFEPTRQTNPTPRSWEFASDLFKMNLREDSKREAMYGCIGEEATARFFGYLKVYAKLPDLNDIIGGKDLFDKDLDIMYAVVSGLSSIAGMAKGSEKRKVFQRLVNYSTKFPKEHIELGAFLVKDLVKMDVDTFTSLDLDKWQSKYEEMVL